MSELEIICTNSTEPRREAEVSRQENTMSDYDTRYREAAAELAKEAVGPFCPGCGEPLTYSNTLRCDQCGEEWDSPAAVLDDYERTTTMVWGAAVLVVAALLLLDRYWPRRR